jgi:chemotaxis protein histidine kinase CheA
VLPLDDAALERSGGMLFMHMDDRFRPLVGLRATLCLPPASSRDEAEGSVVILRLEKQLFGLLVEHAGEPTGALVHPTVDPAPAFATFSAIVQLSDGRDVPVLNPIRLALSLQPVEPVVERRLAA